MKKITTFVRMKWKFYFIIVILSLLTGRIHAQQDSFIDSVRQTMQTLAGEERLRYLTNLIDEYTVSSARLPLAHLLEEEALQQNNDNYYANAIYTFARHFYATNPDSMYYWINVAEPLFIRLGRFEDICRMRSWEIYMFSREGDKEKAITAVDELKRLSNELPFPEGLEMADMALADFYFANNLPQDAERLYLDVLKRMEEREAPLIKRFNIIRQLYNKLSAVEDKLKYLKIAEGYIEQCRAEGLEYMNPENPLYALDYGVHSTYVQAYIKAEALDQAFAHLQKAEAIANEYDMLRSRIELSRLYALYYTAKKDYKEALVYLNRVEENLRQRNLYKDLITILGNKANVLSLMNQPQESNLVYQEYIHLKDSINTIDFNERLADVRTKYQVEKLEMEKQQMETEAEQNRFHMLLLIAGCAVLLAVVFVLIFMIRIIHKNRQALTIAKEKAEEVDRMKSAFLANMNHEIRTPLNAIVGFSQVLIDEEDRENRDEFAGIIQRNNELLQRLIADVLDISKLESNSMSLIYSHQDVSEIMREIYNMLSLRISQEVKLILDPCEPIIFDTDRNRLVQIITNLLTNAIKHTQKGHIRFGYQLLETDIKFYVEDTGEGIQEEELESIFDRFVQLANGKRGVGLGLAISKGLVTKMGGKIWATSIVGVGSTFYVQVPLKRPIQEN